MEFEFMERIYSQEIKDYNARWKKFENGEIPDPEEDNLEWMIYSYTSMMIFINMDLITGEMMALPLHEESLEEFHTIFPNLKIKTVSHDYYPDNDEKPFYKKLLVYNKKYTSYDKCKTFGDVSYDCEDYRKGFFEIDREVSYNNLEKKSVAYFSIIREGDFSVNAVQSAKCVRFNDEDFNLIGNLYIKLKHIIRQETKYTLTMEITS